MSKIVGLTAAVLVSLLLLGARAGASRPSLGTVTSDTNSISCPTYTGGVTFYSGMTCYNGSESGCPNTAEANTGSFSFVYGYATPSNPIGTIVLLSGGDGTTPSSDITIEDTFANDYFNAHYQVVQIAWGSAWEDNGLDFPNKSVGYAACRPASFLSWVYTNLYTPIHNMQGNSTAGMCAQTASAGAGAAAFTLAWYDGGSGNNHDQLDKVTMTSGPVFSDIEQGCGVYPNYQSVTVCPSGQFGCNSANVPSSWSETPVYTGAATGVRSWTGDNSCAGTSYTSTQSNNLWKGMSVVDSVNGQFSYPNTRMTAFLCASVYTNDGDSDDVMNNSSSQGELFYQNFTSSSQIKFLQINAVQTCDTSEGVAGEDAIAPNGVEGYDAIVSDMLDRTNGCVHK